ncbi:MAG: amidoligase family protein [Shimia sp.]
MQAISPRPAFRPLPYPDTLERHPRRIGVEVEFAGLTETQVAALVVDRLGGTRRDLDAHHITVTGTEIGDIQIELDTRFARDAAPLVETALDFARPVVPVEIVTDPLPPEALPALLALLDALRNAGAKGTSDGVLRGFGVHFNPEVVAPEHSHTARTILAFALMEPWLRVAFPPNLSRRVLPFIAPWPPTFTAALVEAAPFTLDHVLTLTARHLTSRNHALDLLPLLAHHDPERLRALMPDDMTKPRPAFHVRFPDCRIGEAGWSLAQEWDPWVLVETVAASDTLLGEIARHHPASPEMLDQLLGPKGARILT